MAVKIITDNPRLRFIGFDEDGIPNYEHTQPFITGYYGCKCHPFLTWEECEKAHRQRFKVGDVVKNRCNGRIGSVTEVKGQYWYGVEGMGTEHAGMLIPNKN